MVQVSEPICPLGSRSCRTNPLPGSPEPLILNVKTVAEWVCKEVLMQGP